jgi:ornithine cyclodeaminase/alanine dehydrogenase-like protein (mu-crystallin family)
VECIQRVYPIGELRVHSRTPAKRAQFAKRVREKWGLRANAVDTGEQAVRGADVVVACTTSLHPVVEGAWLQEGALVCGVGANTPRRCEVDQEVIARAATVVVDSGEQARAESGALALAVETGRFHWENALELSAVVARVAEPRRNPQGVFLFLSHGLAVWDVAALAVLLERLTLASLPSAYPSQPAVEPLP